jgi:hypothetical protein
MARARSTEILPPRLRLPGLVRTGRVRPDEVLEAQLLMRHPNRTGLARRDGRFVAEAEPFHLLRAALGNTRGQRFEALARVEVS